MCFHAKAEYQKDRLTNLTILFLNLTLVARIILKSTAMILIDEVSDDTSNLTEYLNTHDGDDPYSCFYDLS